MDDTSAGTTKHRGQFGKAGRSRSWCQRVRLIGTALFCSTILLCNAFANQQADGEDGPVPVQAPEGQAEAPGRVEIQPVASDEQISRRLADILETTGWYEQPKVTVQDGIVFLRGSAQTAESRQWAGNLANNTQGVVAVVNQIDVSPTTLWNFEPTFQVLADLARRLVRSLPLLVVALTVVAISWMLAGFTVKMLRRGLLARTPSQLLREVTARAGGMLVMLVGLYLVLRIAGLTQLALTVVGGTGLIGLVLGIAFRDITENFLASIFLSFQQPFREGDLIEVAGVTGFVQQLTSRTTVLMTLDGNQLQVPNATVFKNTIRNFTSNPNRRDDFIVGIGYDDSIPAAQEVALKVLVDHPAVLEEPEPLVLVENLGASTVNLRVYFWLDGERHSWLKVKSSVIRLVKRAFQDSGISMPDEAREVVFPDGVAVRMIETERTAQPVKSDATTPTAAPEVVSTKAEAGLGSEAGEIREQARNSWTPGAPGENLLTPTLNAEST